MMCLVNFRVELGFTYVVTEAGGIGFPSTTLFGLSLRAKLLLPEADWLALGSWGEFEREEGE